MIEQLRIISCVPSLTELLFDLGLEDEVVGITKYCSSPHIWNKSKKHIGGTKNIDIEIVKSLNPTLIIANKEENTEEQILNLSKDYKVLLTDINDIDSALEVIIEIGKLTHKEIEASKMRNQIMMNFTSLQSSIKALKIAYIIWYNPIMAAANKSFINDVIERAGLQNVYKNKERYPVTNILELKVLKPDIVFLSSEPFPFQEKHIADWQEQLPESKIVLVDGTMFSWYGSRLINVPEYLSKLIERLQ